MERVLRCNSVNGLSAVWSLFRAANQRAQQVHHSKVHAVEAEDVSADKVWAFVEKKQRQCLPDEREAGDCARSELSSALLLRHYDRSGSG